MKRVLFICIHNSARSQMAEAFLNRLGQNKFIAESAGIEPGTLNQIVIKVMKEIGYDLSKNKTKSVFDIHKSGKSYDYVITVCDPESAERCPIFPGKVNRLHWSFKDPSGFTGTELEKLNFTRKIRDEIKTKIEEFKNNLIS
jgi:arsenate reductase